MTHFCAPGVGTVFDDKIKEPPVSSPFSSPKLSDEKLKLAGVSSPFSSPNSESNSELPFKREAFLCMITERLADLEHEQWMSWSKDVADEECLSGGRLLRWQRLWRPYSELERHEKAVDREWARKALRIVLEALSE